MNDDKDLTNGNNQSEDETTKDKIPLWLQGLEGSEDDLTNQPEDQPNTADSWVKEIEQDAEKIDSDEDAPANANKEIQLPEWIRENPEFVTEEPVSTEILEEPAEVIQDDFAKKMQSEDKLHLEEDFAENEPTDEGFIDISEIDMESPREPVQFIPIEEDDVCEELPVWLHDMITDQPEETLIHNEPVHDERIKEAEEFVLEDQEKVDLETKEEPWQEITSAEDQVHVDGVPVIDTDGFSEIRDEAITKPVNIEADFTDEHIQEEVALSPEEEQETLEWVKKMLDHGDITSAIDSFRQHLDNTPSQEDLEKIYNWIDAVIETSPEDKCDLLELQGDVALKKNEPDQAFRAYSKALKTLFSNKEVDNGTD